MPQKTNLRGQSVSMEEAGRIISKFKRTGEISPQGAKAVEAAIFGYNRISFPRDWSITLRASAKDVMQTAIVLARAEGNINHVLSLEERLLRLPKNSRYRAGRLKNGCGIAQVVILR